MMTCRLCLCSVPAECSVPIYGNSESLNLQELILNCCHLQVREHDRLSHTMCSSCERNLALFAQFKNTSRRSDEKARQRSMDCFNGIKVEEVILDDLDWKSDSNSQLCNLANDEENEIIPKNYNPEEHPNHDKFSMQERKELTLENFIKKDEIPSKLFLTKTNLDVCNSNNSKYECDHCGIVFINKSELISHILMCNSGLIKGINYINKLSDHERDICAKYLINVHQNLKSDKLKKSSKCFISDRKSEIHMKRHTNEILFECKTCSKCFLSNDELAIHRKRHTGDKPFKCEICSKCFMKNSDLKVHKERHTEESPFKCEICSNYFVNNREMALHVRRHDEKKIFKCEICSKCLRTNKGLMRHVERHTGEKPFECEECSKRFVTKGELKTHVRRHTDEKQFKCEICGKCFARSNSLIEHIKRHTGNTPFKCEICLRGFIQKRELTIHMRRHSGEKPFKCEVCSKMHTSKSELGNHMKRHTAPANCWFT
ncbi:uncharacterized protein LOC143917899 [Arctopsyche grandis]|uniref:uncharacterized protein LOC143917899 n=1 Tax=Arctopsyche grandis TaxID=121162 RepID=UPI00406D741C